MLLLSYMMISCNKYMKINCTKNSLKFSKTVWCNKIKKTKFVCMLQSIIKFCSGFSHLY